MKRAIETAKGLSDVSSDRLVASLKPGDVLDGKYSIKRVLGEGGMGVVYEAHHTKLDQPVAIKLMLPEMLSETTLLVRFEREARAAAKLKSKHVARVFDVDATPDGLPFIVMELLEGHDLAAELGEGRQLPVGQAVHILLQVCAAMTEAHQVGIVHRDLKPANVFLAHEGGDRVVAKVLDFGISKDLVASAKITQEHGVVGTVLYMSPEQVRSEPIDRRSDIWSMGALLYEMLSGTKPFDGPVTKVAAAIVSEEPPALRAKRPDLPPGLVAVVAKMLAKSPASRYQDVRAVMDALAPYSPTQGLAPYIEHTSERRIAGVSDSSPNHQEVTADTINAADGVRAPRLATTAGLSSEQLLLAPKPRRAQALAVIAAALAAVVLGAVGVFSAGRPSASPATPPSATAETPAGSAPVEPMPAPASATPPPPPAAAHAATAAPVRAASDGVAEKSSPSAGPLEAGKVSPPKRKPPTPRPAAAAPRSTPPTPSTSPSVTPFHL